MVFVLASAVCLALVINPSRALGSVPANTQYLGVNLAGAEFGSTVPGTVNTDYGFPTTQEVQYFAGKGMHVIRLPFLWERVQDGLNGPLDTAYLSGLDSVISAATSSNVQVLLDMHNYDRYMLNGTPYLVGSAQVPVSALVDVWQKLATHWRGNANIFAYGIMNEPHDTNNTWAATAQAVVNGIRTVDTQTYIAIAGDGWDSAQNFASNNPSFPLTDSASRSLYEGHSYWDADSSGNYTQSYAAQGATPSIGVDKVTPFVTWLMTHNAKGFVGEYGIPNTDGAGDNDQQWLTVLDNFESYLQTQPSIVGGTYWAAGPRWGSYPLSTEPTNLGTSAQADAIQMSVLQKHTTTTFQSASPTATATATATPTNTPAAAGPLVIGNFEGSADGFAGNADITNLGPSTWAPPVALGSSSLWTQYTIPSSWAEVQLSKAVNLNLSGYGTLSASVYPKQPVAAAAGVKVRFLVQGSDGAWYASPYQNVPTGARTTVSWGLAGVPRAPLEQLYVCWQYTTADTGAGNEIWVDAIEAS